MLAQDRGLVGRWFEMHPRSLSSMLDKQAAYFDVDYVTALNDHFEASRPDCVAAGWDPEFSHEAECQGLYFRESDISSSRFIGTYPDSSTNRPRHGEFVWNATHQRADRILIHFSRFPMNDGSGCWVGDIVSGRWGWQNTDASQHGHINMSSPACNSNLSTHAELLYESGWDSAAWQAEVEQYLLDNRELCPRARLSPVTEASPGCPEKTPAGPFDNGVVVHWDSRRLFDGLPVCWVGNLNPNGDGLVWNAYDETGTRVPLLVQATPATQEEPAPSAEAAGICGRTPAMQRAILAALGQSACSEVTDADLATITALSLKTDSVSAADVAGLTAITDIDLELTDGLDAHLASLTTLRNAHITFHLITTNQPILREASERYNIPEDFLPHTVVQPHIEALLDVDASPYGPQHPVTQFISGELEPGSTSAEFAAQAYREFLIQELDTEFLAEQPGFHNLRFTISDGQYPGYPYSEGPAKREHRGLSSHLLASGWIATNVHIVDHSNRSILAITQPFHGPLTAGTITNLVIEFETPPDFRGSHELRGGYGTEFYTGRNLRSLKIVHLNPDETLYIPEDFLPGGQISGDPYFTLEIKGRLDVHNKAFYNVYFLKELHLDPESDGDEHPLHFNVGRYVVPPSGTGFINLSQ